MNTSHASAPALAAPYTGHLERGPDTIYAGPAIRIDLAGYGGALHLGWEGCTMAECPDDYAAHVIRCANAAPAMLAALEAAHRSLVTCNSCHGIGTLPTASERAEIESATLLARAVIAKATATT